MAAIDDFLREWHSPSDYIEAHTSGSTGAPKRIRLLKHDMLVSARATNRRFGISTSSVLALPLSIDYIAGKMMCVRAIEAGCTLLEMPVSNHIVVDRHVDLLAVVPSQVDSLLAQSDAHSLVGNLIVGGAPLDAVRAEALRCRGFRTYSTYGMTETCSHVALADISDPDAPFVAMPGISFELDSRSCLVVIAPEFSFRRLVTNDIVDLHDSHTFHWLGRADNVINSGGIKIPAEQLEHDLAPYINVPFYVVGCKDSRWGEVPVIVFEGSPDDVQAIIDTLRDVIDHRRCPRKAFAVKTLPRTPNGKLLRNPPHLTP